MGQQEQSQVPHHPFRMQTRSPYSRERSFLTANACTISFFSGVAGQQRTIKHALPSLHGARKSPGRLPRPVKVKNLTPQEKVKEWIQTLPPTRTATSEAILIIMMRTQMQVQLEIWSRYLNSFTLGWWGNVRHSCKGSSPFLSLPYTGTAVHYLVKYKYFQ